MSTATMGGGAFMPTEKPGKGTLFFIIANVALYVLCIPAPVEGLARQYLYLNTSAPFLWQTLTYMFFHADGIHLFFNLLIFFFFAPQVEDHFGTKAFVRYILTCGIGAGVVSYLIAFLFPGPIGLIVGFSGALYGTMYAFHRFMPEAIVNLLGVFPIKLKYLLLAYLVFSVLQIIKPTLGDSVAHGAHFGGLLVGFLWFRYTESFMIIRDSWNRKKEVKREEQRVASKEELDRILEKISSDGMGALTRGERNFLNRTSQNIKKKN